MGSHFAKHLSPLVLASEHEMSFDSVGATVIFHPVSWVPSRGLFYMGSTWGGDSLDEGLLGAIPRHQWGLRSLTAASGRDCTYEGQLWSSRAMLETFLQVGCRGVFHNTTTQRQCFLYT